MPVVEMKRPSCLCKVYDISSFSLYRLKTYSQKIACPLQVTVKLSLVFFVFYRNIVYKNVRRKHT